MENLPNKQYFLDRIRCKGYSLLNVPYEYMDFEMCKLAVITTPKNLYHVPKEIKTQEFCNKVFENNIATFYWMPARYMSFEMCKKMITNCISAFKHVPADFKTFELCEIFVEEVFKITKHTNTDIAYNCISEIKHVPAEYKTLEWSKNIVEKLLELPNHENLVNICDWFMEIIPPENKTVEMCMLATNNNYILSFDYCNIKYLTSDFCMKVVEIDYFIFKNVPENLQTLEMCLYVVGKNGTMLQFVSDKFKTLEMCLCAFAQSPNNIMYIPDKIKTPEMCNSIDFEDKKMAMLFEYIPNEFKTLIMCKNAVKNAGKMLAFVPKEIEENISYESFLIMCIMAVLDKPNAFKFVPDKYKIPDMCNLIIECNCTSVFQYLPSIYKKGFIIIENIKDLDCPICLNDNKTKNDSLCQSVKCKHIFHKSCIEAWLDYNETCPVCRDIIKPKDYCLHKFLFTGYTLVYQSKLEDLIAKMDTLSV